MLYRITCDNYTIYNPQVQSDELVLSDVKLKLESNTAGSLTFNINPNHPYYNYIFPFRSIINVYRNNTCIWRGRVTSEGEDFNRKQSKSCEGALAFLNDVQYPCSKLARVGGLQSHIASMLNAYNANASDATKIYWGTVTVDPDVTDHIMMEPNDYMPCFDRLSQLLDVVGGYVTIRIANDGKAYLDYNYGIPETQAKTIRFGVNLLDLKRETQIESLKNAILPLGALLSEDNDIERLDISSIADGPISGTNYTKSGLYVIDQDSIDLFGRYETVETWENVTNASSLIGLACNKLESISSVPIQIEAQFIDMNYIDPSQEPINILDSAMIFSVPHNYATGELVPILAMELDLNNPANNKYTVSETIDVTMVDYILQNF